MAKTSELTRLRAEDQLARKLMLSRSKTFRGVPLGWQKVMFVWRNAPKGE